MKKRQQTVVAHFWREFEEVYAEGQYYDESDALDHAAHVLSFDDDSDLVITLHSLKNWDEGPIYGTVTL